MNGAYRQRFSGMAFSLVLALFIFLMIPSKALASEDHPEMDAYILLPEEADLDAFKTLSERYEEETGIVVEVIRAEEEYGIALQKYLARLRQPAVFLLESKEDAYAFEGFLTELRDTGLSDIVRYAPLYLFYEGRAVGIPTDASRERAYFALNSFAAEEDRLAGEGFLSFVLSGDEGRILFPDAGLHKLYHETYSVGGKY